MMELLVAVASKGRSSDGSSVITGQKVRPTCGGRADMPAAAAAARAERYTANRLSVCCKALQQQLCSATVASPRPLQVGIVARRPSADGRGDTDPAGDLGSQWGRSIAF
jgi:hypothetical protein